MKTLLTTFTLVFTLIFSSTSFAKWTKVVVNEYATHYVDFEGIRKHDGYVYYWSLYDSFKPVLGSLSGTTYHQGDCGLFRTKKLSFVSHKQPMGRGVGETYNPKNPEWVYASPGSVYEDLLQAVCRVTP
jgi:hypothetical protein